MIKSPEDEDGEFEVDALSGPKSAKLSQERCDVLWRRRSALTVVGGADTRVDWRARRCRSADAA